MDNIPESVREQERRVKELVEELNRNKSTQGAPTDGDSTDDTGEGDGQEQLGDTNADPGFGESGWKRLPHRSLRSVRTIRRCITR